jgi:hypothetical protein
MGWLKLLVGECWERTPAMAKSEESVSRSSGSEGLKTVRMGAVVKAVLSLVKAVRALRPKLKGTSF